MKRFTILFTELDQTSKTSVKVKALAEYFKIAAATDKLWTVALFSGRHPKRAVTTKQLRHWAAEHAGIPLWLFEESYPVVGDLAETLALILPPARKLIDRSLSDWINWLVKLHDVAPEARRPLILQAWDQLGVTECFLFNKLITGGFRIGVSQKLMTRALAQATGRDQADLAHRLMGNWNPATITWQALIESDHSGNDLSRPYPFYLAHSLENLPEVLGPPSAWSAEWKWDGIRGQIIVRQGKVFVWSRGEELITDRFPEFADLAEHLPDGTVLDGELLAWQYDRPLPFNTLQKRIGRKTVPKNLLIEAPIVLNAYDMLEFDGQDLRNQTYARRRGRLERLIKPLDATVPLRLTKTLTFTTWQALSDIRATARDKATEGVMIKRRDSLYGVGRKRGDWWKWKLDPLTIDAVMIYAQAGHGRRATLFTDFTFAVWQGDTLVPFAKAYSGLTDDEYRQITKWVRKNTLKRFGPVRQVTAEHVFEIAFEGLHASTRHKSGVALRFPRMRRWRQDKVVQQANTLDDLKEMLQTYG